MKKKFTKKKSLKIRVAKLEKELWFLKIKLENSENITESVCDFNNVLQEELYKAQEQLALINK